MQYWNNNYFTLPSLPWMINIILWFYIGVYSSVFIPHLVPYHYVGPAGTLIRFVYTKCPYVAHFVLISGSLAHLCEAFYSLRLCSLKGIVGPARVKWFLSTAIFGGTSLYELVIFEPQPNMHID